MVSNGIIANALYFAQQAAEKATKALLILYGKFYARAYRKRAFSQGCFTTPRKEERMVERLRKNIFELERYWLKPRYPMKKGGKVWNPVGKYRKAEADKAIKKAEECIRLVEKLLEEVVVK